VGWSPRYDRQSLGALGEMSRDFAAAADTEALAASSVRWIRLLVGRSTAVRVALPDRAGRLRTAWKAGDHPELGRRRSARRRIAFEEKRPIRLDLGDVGGRALVIFPLACRDHVLGVLEVLGESEAIEDAWELLETAVGQMAIASAHLSEQRALRREVETLERAALLGGDLVRAALPSDAVRVAARFTSERFEVPVAGWLISGDPGRMQLVSVHGLGSRKRKELRSALGVLPRWNGLLPVEREAAACHFGEVLGARDVVAVHAGEALLLAANATPELQTSFDVIGSLLKDVLQHLAVIALAERRNEQLDLGIAWTAHELRAPVLGVKAVLELILQKQSSNEVGAAMLRRSLRELEMLAGTTEGLLGWAVGARPLRRSYMDIVTLVDEVAESCQLESDEGRILVIAPERAVAYVDPVHLRAAVANVVRNALACSPSDRKVEVTVEERGDGVTISVSDHGSGIGEAERASIFDPFVQGAAGLARTGGNGLGLFIARRVIEAHGGDIWMDSDPRGTTFRLQVPTGTARDRRPAS